MQSPLNSTRHICLRIHYFKNNSQLELPEEINSKTRDLYLLSLGFRGWSSMYNFGFLG
jgi:hypothetical protein